MTKYSGENDSLTFKLTIFHDICARADVPYEATMKAFPTMLKGLALDYYCGSRRFHTDQITSSTSFVLPTSVRPTYILSDRLIYILPDRFIQIALSTSYQIALSTSCPLPDLDLLTSLIQKDNLLIPKYVLYRFRQYADRNMADYQL